ncbi:ABC transporter ATP-binding protein/permease [Kibdelosporangium philippinense]|uniref:ABC transporter ATP-binding protein/permease n=1 Tax=Kibdelosporangium philippinense TaxID=211113 RepID=A0ABS8ZGM0_9PSEU|nr:ABC transporter ATP-binding protein [Kibdelosporangium philippinense]MCE7006459.1 ABC transporter ATP-binding protein/permease [Kibdelosporangium philippinense]
MSRELLPIATPPRVRAVVGELLSAHKGRAVAAFGVMLVATAIGTAVAPLLGHIVDTVKAGQDALLIPVIWLVVVAVSQGLTTVLGTGMIARLGETMLATLRERFVSRALTLPLEKVEKAGSGDLTSRVSNDVTAVADVVRRALPELARASLTIVLTLAGMAVLDWRFALAALLAAPIQFHTVRWYLRHAPPLYAAHRESVGAQQQQLLDTVGGAHTVRAFRLADAHVARVQERSNAAVALALKGVRIVTQFFGRLNLAEFVGLSAVLVTGFILVNNNAVTIGVASAAAVYFHNLFTPINIALSLVDDAQSAAASMARIVGVADLPATPLPDKKPVTDALVKAASLGHAYVDGHPVLTDVDLQVAPGERIALVGASGAGKTTLVKLIAGIHKPSTGTISVGGADLQPGAVALVSQEVHVFAGTLAEDLRLANPDATDEHLRAALELVGWDAVDLDTVVGDGGHRLTVAQSQKLALARLVLADPAIAILDEATAEAGSAGARELEVAADAALSGRTALVVAHRLTQAASADRIVVLDNGRVVESGTHNELLALDGRYATLWSAWSGSR